MVMKSNNHWQLISSYISLWSHLLKWLYVANFKYEKISYIFYKIEIYVISLINNVMVLLKGVYIFDDA